MSARQDATRAAAGAGATSRPRRSWLTLLQLLVTLLILGFLLRDTSLDDLRRLREHWAPGYIWVSAALTVLGGVAGAAALLALFDLRNHWPWRGRFALDYLYVQALCQLTPAQMGEAALPYIASRGRFSTGEVAAALVIQRLVALLIVVVAALTGAGRWAPAGYLWGAALAVVGAGVVLMALISNARVRARINETIGRRFGPILAGFYEAWRSMLRDRPGRLVLHVVFMVLRYAITIGGSYAVLAAFGIQVPFAELAALTAVAVLASLAPLTINGVGITEGIFVLALAGYGYSSEKVLVACLAGRLMTALVMAACAALYLALEWCIGRGGPARGS